MSSIVDTNLTPIKYKFIFPALGAAVALLGLCFPSGSLYGKLDFWMLGVGEVKPNIVEYLEILHGHTFIFLFLFIVSLGIVSTLLICVCCVFLIIFSYDLKNKKRNNLKWITNSPLLLLGGLAGYIYILIFFVEGFEQGPGTVIIFVGGIISMPSLFSGVRRASFRINEYIVVKLRRGETMIYIAKKLYIICKHLIIDIPIGNINTVDTLDHVIEKRYPKQEL